ncbi:nitrate- and nitrite sensing domain-containing protein [Maricaulis sp.]|uniref:methyl-accepting chemotaxis protein n=1 Tax=Maricaulis sp. TaxID=1486257 RepID=UPI0026341D45|nr:nitrate- and nitrite sensing domain-containing protein [Maricaulis sp.]
MRFFTPSIMHRLGAAVGVPVIGLLVFAFMFVGSQQRQSAEMARLAELTAFGGNISAVIHELQRERGNTAGFIGSQGGEVFRDRLARQRDVTDRVIAQYYQAFEAKNLALYSEAYAAQVERANDLLEAIAAHRDAVDALQINLGAGVAPYTTTINAFLEAYVEEVHESRDAEMTEGMISLLNLMEAKENAGIERAIGANSFGQAAVPRSNHQRVYNLRAAQDAYIHEFKMVMGETWAARFDETIAPTQAEVDRFRAILVEAGYGAAVPEGQGGAWFDASTRRIDAMMEVETEFNQYLYDQAQEKLATSNRATLIVFAVALLVTIGTIWLSVVVTLGVVSPIKRIATNLDDITQGCDKIDIKGAERQDEIGSLARAAKAFLADSAQRRMLERKQAEQEKASLEQRTTMMRTMSEEVESSSERSLGRVVTSATDIRERAMSVRESLVTASETAQTMVDEATRSREQSGEAAEQADQLIVAINEVTEQITRSDELARDAVQRAEVSSQTVGELRDAASQIGNFVEIINDLAEQTNLLALNATIEAARAGEAGKGFAVVASEVKALASQTNKSASEIHERVAGIQDRTAEAVDAISAISGSIATLSEVTTAVSAAMEEQRASTESFRTFVEETRQATGRVAGGVQSISEAAEKAASEAREFAGTAEDMADMSELARHEIPRIVTAASQRAEQEAARLQTQFNYSDSDDDASENSVLWS